MRKLYVIMGKSCSGKNIIYSELIKRESFKPIILYTTRPMRNNEVDGEDYRFVSNIGKLPFNIIEKRTYNVGNVVWEYATLDDGQLKENGNYITINTLAGFIRLREFYKDSNVKVIPIYIYTSDSIRLKRAYERELLQEKPNYEEILRRYFADASDFSGYKLLLAGIVPGWRFENDNLDECIDRILSSLSFV